MPEIVIHRAVLKGRHAYSETQVAVGGIYKCVREVNNAVDGNAFVVLTDQGQIIGHSPKELSDHFHCIFENKKNEVTIFW